MAHLTDEELTEIISVLKTAEKLLAGIPDRIDLIAQLDKLKEDLERLPAVHLDTRILQIRLTSKFSSDPDKTPVDRVGSVRMPAVRPEPEEIRPRPYDPNATRDPRRR